VFRHLYRSGGIVGQAEAQRSGFTPDNLGAALAKKVPKRR